MPIAVTERAITRILSLAAPAGQDALKRLAEAEGVLSIQTTDGRHLRITYDVSRTGLAVLERSAESLGLTPSGSLLARVARAWGAFQDDNLRSQAHLVHHCCNAPPVRR